MNAIEVAKMLSWRFNVNLKKEDTFFS